MTTFMLFWIAVWIPIMGWMIVVRLTVIANTQLRRAELEKRFFKLTTEQAIVRDEVCKARS